ncbi:MAG: hypothetical protein MdMp014T_1619 [Treponematales bacterium]
MTFFRAAGYDGEKAGRQGAGPDMKDGGQAPRNPRYRGKNPPARRAQAACLKPPGKPPGAQMYFCGAQRVARTALLPLPRPPSAVDSPVRPEYDGKETGSGEEAARGEGGGWGLGNRERRNGFKPLARKRKSVWEGNEARG